MLNHTTERVEGVEKNAIEIADFGFHIARHREVDNKHRFAATKLKRALNHAFADNGQGGCGGGNDGIEFVNVLRQLLQGNRACVKALRKLFTAFQCAIRHYDLFGRHRRKMRGRQLNHFTDADQQKFNIANVAKQLLRKLERCGRHAHGRGTNIGFGAHFFRDFEGVLKQPIQRAR